MMLSSQKQDDPFGAMLVLRDRRSMLSSDLSNEDLELLAEFLPAIVDPWLKGRIAHLLWLQRAPREYQHALEAIDNYTAIPLTTEAWIRDGNSCWSQALMWAKSLAISTSSRLQDMESRLVAAALGKPPYADDMTLYIEPLLREQRLGLGHAADIAHQLTMLGHSFHGEGKFMDAGPCFQRSQWWFAAADVHGDAHEAAIREADSYVAEAEQRASSDQPSQMIAASWYEEALRALRTVPQADRAALQVEERIQDVRRRHSDAIGEARHEVAEIEMPGIDISELVLSGRSAVTGKPTDEAMSAFLNMIQPPDIERYRERAEASVESPSIRHLISGVYHSADGRTVGARPSVSPLLPDTDRERFVLSEMIFEYQFFVGICSSQILAVLDSMHSEHRLTELDFVALAELSPIVPRGRAVQVGKALYYGYERDFIAATAIIVPQIENALRETLANAGLEASTIQASGIHRYKSLENLLALDGAKERLGPNLHFELSALLSDPFREGLRNEVAHGLLSDDKIVSATAIYVWWVFLRLVFNPVWLSRKDALNHNSEGEGATSSPE